MTVDYRPILFWIKEREQVRINKLHGIEPYTNDPILSNNRFCNVRREDDRVTKWIRENIRELYSGHEYLWFMLCIARQINWPDTLKELIANAWPNDNSFNPSKITTILNNRKSRGEKIYTGAYMISAPHEKGADKQKYIAENVLGELWYQKDKFPHSSTLENTHAWLKSFNGWGSFMAYQAVVDMRFTNILSNAPDVETWAAAGPGTIRGLNRIHLREVSKPLKQDQALLEMREVYKVVKDANITSIDFSDIPNILCETDKYMRIWYGEGRTRAKYVMGRGY